MKKVLEVLAPWWDDNPKALAWPPTRNYYEHYAQWAGLVKPRRYCEIGVAYGWSVMAVLAGWPKIEEIHLIDNELYQIDLKESVGKIMAFFNSIKKNGQRPPHITWLKVDTKKLTKIGMPGFFDMVHVDGEHSDGAVYHDLHLALEALTPKGTIIVDDFRLVGHGIEKFEKDHPELNVMEVATHQIHHLLWRK